MCHAATENAPNSSWGKTYNIGIGSLLFWAVGLQPSKDVTWTTPHQPGGACSVRVSAGRALYPADKGVL